MAVGVLVLPLAVLTTAATSCAQPTGVERAGVVRGDWYGGQPRDEDRVLVSGARRVAVDDRGRLRELAASDAARLPEGSDGETEPVACSTSAPARCWRAPGEGTAAVVVSEDGGRTWGPDYALDQQTADDLIEANEGCGEKGSVATERPSVLDGPQGPVVVVAAHHAGLLIRSPDGRWDRYPPGRLHGAPVVPAVRQPVGPLQWRTPSPLDPGPTIGPLPPTPTSPGPTCPSPTTVRVTPDPRNGPPFDRVDCPP